MSERQTHEQFRIALDASFIADKKYKFISPDLRIGNAGLKRRLNAKLSYYQRIGGTANSAVFAQGGYYGSDPYNIYFAQSAWFFRFGLSFLYFHYQEKNN